ncbi:MAG: STAS domain-containing protein [Chloracidobacterium sp.]|uniref:Anti-sigma factor antagonist n=1 Tax=Chloracidobacterium validum TaxID=2821543 RepID=A0ABX8B6Q2_9BACT|nr:STAS domain-containing protein [Chloracidobacterium validum]QUW02117.1 STAS domain-containing protein [Chloracidobacterium validum]
MKSSENDGERGAGRPLARRPTRYRLDKKVNGVCVLEVVGRLAPSTAQEELTTRVDDLIASGHVNFLIDLRGVSYISSTGVGSLIECYHHAERAGGKLKLLNPSQAVRQILTVSKLDSVFDLWTDEDAALLSFGASDAGTTALDDDPPTLTPEAARASAKETAKSAPAGATAGSASAALPAAVPGTTAPPSSPPPTTPQARIVKAADAPPLKKSRSRRAKSSS